MHSEDRTDRSCATDPRQLGEVELRTLLDEVRARAAQSPPDDASAFEATLAALECEAARRGLQLLPLATEPTPPLLAARLLDRALLASDRELAARALQWTDAGHMFVAWRRVREHPDRAFRIACLTIILFRLDLSLLGFASAVARREQLDQGTLEPSDLEAYADHCVASMFAAVFSGPQQGGEQ